MLEDFEKIAEQIYVDSFYDELSKISEIEKSASLSGFGRRIYRGAKVAFGRADRFFGSKDPGKFFDNVNNRAGQFFSSVEKYRKKFQPTLDKAKAAFGRTPPPVKKKMNPWAKAAIGTGVTATALGAGGVALGRSINTNYEQY